MSTAKLIGILTDVFPVETPHPNFKKKVFWLREPDTERYPQHWEIELHQEDTDRLKGVEIGDRLECEVECRGRKWHARGEDKIFTSLKCIGIKVLGKAITVPNKAGSFKPITKPGRESDADRKDPQSTLPM